MDEIQHKNALDGISVNDEVPTFAIVLKINHFAVVSKQPVARQPMGQFAS